MSINNTGKIARMDDAPSLSFGQLLRGIKIGGFAFVFLMFFADDLGQSNPGWALPANLLGSIVGGFIAAMFGGKSWLIPPGFLVVCVIVFGLIVASANLSAQGPFGPDPGKSISDVVLPNSLRVVGIGIGAWLGYLVFIRPLPEE